MSKISGNSAVRPTAITANGVDDPNKDDSLVVFASSNPMVPEGQLPMYLADAFAELYEEDGLIVMGKGMGCLSLLATFCRFYADTEEGHVALLLEEQQQQKPQPAAATSLLQRPPLVMVLGLHQEHERTCLLQILTSWGTPPEWLPTLITNESGQAKDRQQLYARGGVFVITSRILITDLLTNVVTANQIDGMLVAHADQIVSNQGDASSSTEAFILRIFHAQKQPQCGGFVKGFSDSAEGLQSGFAKVDKVLKALRVRRLYLYPRFQELVRQELEARPPSVMELHQPLSPLQKEVQSCIAAAVQACVRELKQSTTKLEWNDMELSKIENCVTAQFDRTIRRQLEPEWHKLTPQTKQLVQDLKTLRTLFQALLDYDCVSFYKLLVNIKNMSAASRYPSMWLLTPAADLLFRKAKERVYRIETSSADACAKLVTVLEENPKWKLLRKILDEIKDEYNNNCKNQKPSENELQCSVLVMVKDNRTLDTVKAYLTGGKRKAIPLTWLRFLEHVNDRSRAITNRPDGIAALSEERRLLLEEEGRTRRILFGHGSKKNPYPSKKNRTLNQVPAYLKKRRRIATEKGRGHQDQSQDDLDREAVLDEALEEVEHELVNPSDDDEGDEEDSTNEEKGAKQLGTKRRRISQRLLEDRQRDEETEQEMIRVSNQTDELRVMLRCFTEGSDQGLLLLQDIRPTHVVFYDVNIAFVRNLEIFSSLLPADTNCELKVYFLVFEASSEDKNFKRTLQREQESFERLIQHKITMPPPMLTDNTMTQEMQLAQGSAVGTYMDGTLPLAFDSRRGQGKNDSSKRRRDIAVDVREFRSALPSILHQGGMRLAPVTLTVGDFVLSNVHCIERKSISDLFGSFASGRLYTQAEAMCKHYKAPCLLIEFDPTKSFCLQNPSELGMDIKNDSACTKLSLLCMHFPLLRILWSKSPYETLKIFQDLKKTHEEVDVDRAVEVGRNESLETLFQGPNVGGTRTGENGEDEVEEDEINEAARDMLLRLPGVTVQAARRIMEQVDSLKELSELSRDDLRRIAGPVAGQKLFTFFRQQQA